MVKSASFAPDPPPGKISEIVIASWDTDDQFKASLRRDQEEIRNYYTRGAEGVKELVASLITNPEGPFPFLAVTQPALGGSARVEVLHAAKPYRRSRLQPPGQDLDLIDRTYMFGGEMHLEDGAIIMPNCYVFPKAVDAAFVPSSVKVPTPTKLNEAFTTYLTAAARDGGTITELMASNLESTNEQLPKVLAIPSVLLPVFIHQPHPSEALQVMKLVIADLPEDHRSEFDNILCFLRAACVKTGGSSAATKNLSRMITVWNSPAVPSPTFRSWQKKALKTLYEAAFSGVTSAPTSAVPAFGPTFFEGLEKVINSGVTAAKAAFPPTTTTVSPESKEEKSKWSPLMKEQIIRAHGLPVETEWTSPEISDIWADYEDEMKGSISGEVAIQRAFTARIEDSPSIERGHQAQPIMTRHTAKDIKAGRLAPMQGLLSYDNCDIGLMPLAFVPRSVAEVVEEQYEDDEYQDVTFRTVDTEKARSNRMREKKAPNSFHKSQRWLQCYATAIKQHFTSSSPLYRATSDIFVAFELNYHLWEPEAHFSETVAARFAWLFTKLCYTFLSAKSWNPDGTAPFIDPSHIINAINIGAFPMVIGMPRELIDWRTSKPTAPLAPPPPVAGKPTPIGVPSSLAMNGEHKNPAVHTKVQAMLAPALDKLGGTAKLGTILSIAAGLGPPVQYAETILHPDHCQEFLSVGRCALATCRRTHQPGFMPNESMVDNFIAKMEAPIGAIINASPEQLQAARRRKRQRT